MFVSVSFWREPRVETGRKKYVAAGRNGYEFNASPETEVDILELLKKRTRGQDANDIERKERMRIMRLQRLVADRLSAERNAARDQLLQRQSMEVDENGKYRSMNDPVGGGMIDIMIDVSLDYK